MNKETTSANAKPTSPTSLCIFEHLISHLPRSTPEQQFKVPIKIAIKMSGKFEPKHKVDLDPPKDDPISLDYLSKCDGWSDVMDTRKTSLTSTKEHMRDIQHTWLSRYRITNTR